MKQLPKKFVLQKKMDGDYLVRELTREEEIQMLLAKPKEEKRYSVDELWIKYTDWQERNFTIRPDFLDWLDKQ